MSQTIMNPRCFNLYDVNTQIKDKAIRAFITKHLPNVFFQVALGCPYYTNGEECRRVYVTVNKLESVDEFMKKRPFYLNKRPLRVTRNIPNSCHLYDRSVTGLKITIRESNHGNQSTQKLNGYDLKKYFETIGTVLACKWTNADETEALFKFNDYDVVDQIILQSINSPIVVNEIKLHVEKVITAQDCPVGVRPYVIHVTDLPAHVTSEELSSIFRTPVSAILLHPCLHIEQSHIYNARTSSEAWIRDPRDERALLTLAKAKSGTLLHAHKIRCEVIPEPINEQDLCEHFEKGPCPYALGPCDYKHFTCAEPDTCENRNCRLGHSEMRTTVSYGRSEYRSSDLSYRIKLSNLPPNVTHDELMQRLNLDQKFSHFLRLQPVEQVQHLSRMAYLVKQLSENKLRRQIDQWHDKQFSSLASQPIKCQLEINQDLFEWDDANTASRSLDNSRCVSPSLSTFSIGSYGSKRAAWQTNNPVQFASPTSQTVAPTNGAKLVLAHRQNQAEKKSMHFTSLRLTTHSRQQPSDMSSIAAQWRWTKSMLSNDQFARDELYCIEEEANNQRKAWLKIYSGRIHLLNQVRSQCERVALKKLDGVPNVPKLLLSNVEPLEGETNGNQSGKEFWNIISSSDSETFSDYVRRNKPNLRDAVRVTRQLLTIIQQIHRRHVIHRDIQPKNILVQHSPDEISLTLIGFDLAWMSGYKWTQSVTEIENRLGNTFYPMPQFEKGSSDSGNDEIDQQFMKSRRSPTIDATGAGAILFSLCTRCDPRQSKDIHGVAPHQSREHAKTINKRIEEVTAFWTEKGRRELLERQLTLVFDCTFADPAQQWSVTELDYQLQFILALIASGKDEYNYFPVPQNTNTQMPLYPIPLADNYIYIGSFINRFKDQFAARYAKCIRWLTTEKSRWINNSDGTIENYDSLIFCHQSKDISIDISWHVAVIRDNHFSTYIKGITTNSNTEIKILLAPWKKSGHEADLDASIMDIEMAIKILINVLCKNSCH